MNRVLFCLLVLAAISCGRSQQAEPSRAVDAESSPSAAASRPSADARDRRIVALGDSLTAGLGIPREHAWPAVLQETLGKADYAVEIINAGVSGDTTADGLRRAEWALEGHVAVLILALGGNDGLRGLPPAQMEDNLRRIIQLAQKRSIPVLLAGMEAPPNYGERYAAEFRDVFGRLGKEERVTFVPFLLEGVAGVGTLNQGDGIHPNRAGAERIAEHLFPVLRRVLDDLR